MQNWARKSVLVPVMEEADVYSANRIKAVRHHIFVSWSLWLHSKVRSILHFLTTFASFLEAPFHKSFVLSAQGNNPFLVSWSWISVSLLWFFRCLDFGIFISLCTISQKSLNKRCTERDALWKYAKKWTFTIKLSNLFFFNFKGCYFEVFDEYCWFALNLRLRRTIFV